MKTRAFLIALLASTLFAPPVVISPAPALAQADSAAVASAPPPGAPVTLDGHELFRVQANIKGYTPELRASTISDRILRIAQDRRHAIDSVKVTDTEISADVRIGDLPLFSVFDEDAKAAGRDRLALATERATATRAAIEMYRVSRAAKSLAMGGVWSLVATIGLAVYLFLAGRWLRWTLGVIENWIEPRRENIRRRSKSLIPPEHIQGALQSLARAIRLALVLVGIYIYLQVVLSFFPWTQALAANLLGLVLNPLRSMAAALWKNLPGLIFIVVLIFVMRAVLKFVDFIFDEIESGRLTISGFYPEWAKPTYNIVRILALVFTVIVAYPYIPGSGSDAFKGVSIFLGVLVSLGSTSAVANIVAGIILTYMRAFKVGEVISVGDQRGLVTEMSLLATHIRTPKNVEVTIPNATVLSSHVTNFSTHCKEQGLILHTTVGVRYDVPWRQVHAMLLSAARETKGVLPKPEPFVLQRGLEDFCVRYELNAYTDQPQGMLLVYSELHKRILDAFNEYGVQIMTPDYEGDRTAPAVVPKERWYAAPAKQPGEAGADE